MKKTQNKFKNQTRNFSNFNLQTSPGGQSLTENYLKHLKQSQQASRIKSTVNITQKPSQDFQQNLNSLSQKIINTHKTKNYEQSKSPQNSFLKCSSQRNKENLSSNQNLNYIKNFQQPGSVKTKNYLNNFHSHQNSINPTPSYFLSKRESLSGNRTDLGQATCDSKFSQKSEPIVPCKFFKTQDYNQNPNILESKETLSDQFGIKCEKHQDKKAKYQLWDNDGQIVYYCSKCAVLLAQNGHQIIEIPGKNDKYDVQQNKIKEDQLQHFLSQITTNSAVWEQTRQNFAIKKDEVEKYYSKQINKSDKFFAYLEQQIQKKRQEVNEDLENKKYQMETMYQKKEVEIEELVKGYMSIKSDMVENYHKILTTIDFEPFQDIMNMYVSKYQEIERFFDNISHESFKVMKFEPNQELSDQFDTIIPQLYEYSDMRTNLIKKNRQNLIQSTTPQKATSKIPEISAFKNDQNTVVRTCYDQFPQSPSHIQHTHPKLPTTQNSIYVSFENKELFQTALTSKQKQDKPIQQFPQEFPFFSHLPSQDIKSSSKFGIENDFRNIQIENIDFSGNDESQQLESNEILENQNHFENKNYMHEGQDVDDMQSASEDLTQNMLNDLSSNFYCDLTSNLTQNLQNDLSQNFYNELAQSSNMEKSPALNKFEGILEKINTNYKQKESYYQDIMQKKADRYSEGGSECGLFGEEFSKSSRYQKMLFMDGSDDQVINQE